MAQASPGTLSSDARGKSLVGIGRNPFADNAQGLVG